MDYITAARETLLPLSRSTELHGAFLEWQYTGHCFDRGNEDGACGLCYTPIRYEFEIRNPHTGNALLVGSKCVTRFDIDNVEDAKSRVALDLKRLKEQSTTIPVGNVDLYTAKHGPAIRGLITAGHFGVSDEDELVDLGATIDVLLLAGRPKAVDATRPRKPIVSIDRRSEEFKRIQERSERGEGDCKIGISLLLFEQLHGFLEFFCSNFRSRPVAYGAYKQFLFRDAQRPVRFLSQKSGEWHSPVAIESPATFTNMPHVKVLSAAINEFQDGEAVS